MKYIDEYRNPQLAKALLSRIASLADDLEKPVTIMEVCGSHTMAIGRFGIRKLLPEKIHLVSGPGCPVCVTSIRDVDIALYLAGMTNTIFATFGDMLRVPGTGGMSLQQLRASGADIRVVSSPLDAIEIAEANPRSEVIFMGIGFETTSPTIAAAMKRCRKTQVRNLSLFSVHKTIPPAMKVLIDDAKLNIDGFLCPGHVSIIIGAHAYDPIAEAGRAAVITGFEPADVLEGIEMVMQQIRNKDHKVEIQYTRAVNPEGNRRAREFLDEVFRTDSSEWRGLGNIPGSGLFLKEDYKTFDALLRFDIPDIQSAEMTACMCGDILRGIASPDDCPLYRRLCNPLNPVGPCMVSSEGTCAAFYKYNN
jgi:hydrogenase expression/formation protein HypD